MKILVGATAAGHKGAEAGHWLRHAEALRRATPHELEFFLATETQPDGIEPRLAAVEARVHALGGTVWRFMLDDGAARIDGGNRLVRICTGRNLVIERALRSGAEWILFADADIELPPDLLVRLLELRHPFCGFHVPGYGLSGPPVPGYGFPVQAYWNTAGAWFVQRTLFRRFRWLWDPDAGLTDDPATYRVIREQLGVEQYNRLDVVGRHGPLRPFETRAGDVQVRRHPLDDHPIVAVVVADGSDAPQLAQAQQQALDLLDERCARVLLVDTAHPHDGPTAYAALAGAQPPAGERLQIVPAPGCRVPQAWNIGWQLALQDFGDPVLVAFVSPGARFRPGLLEVLARAVLPREVWGTFPDADTVLEDGVRLSGRALAARGIGRHGGTRQHAFLIKGGLHTLGGVAMFDERFRCDPVSDDFARRVERAGYGLRAVEGLPCDHADAATEPPTAWRQALDEDRALLAALWPAG